MKQSSMNQALAEMKLRGVHWRVWSLSAMGVFLDGFDLFIIAVALPLINDAFLPVPFMQGMIGAAAVLGTVAGAAVGGRLIDAFGRKSLYLVDLAFFILFSVCTALSWSIWSLIVFRFLLGIGIGIDYPICASYVSEFMPPRIRGRMLVSAFSFQALGMLAGAGVGLIVLALCPALSSWRWMLAVGAAPALIVLILRRTVPESPRWLLEHGKLTRAIEVMRKIIPEKKDKIPDLVKEEIALLREDRSEKLNFGALFSPRYIKRTILAVVPWFLMDIATYSVGIFMPMILSLLAMGGKLSTIAKDFAATEGALFLDVFLVLGFILNIWLVDKWGRIKLQVLGFAGMVIGLLILSVAAAGGTEDASLLIVLPGFILFNLFMNMGPNATTFILPAEVFPTRIRASGHGLATAVAKMGAALGIFLMPLLQDRCGTAVTMLFVAGAAMAGLLVTIMFRVNTMGRSLEELNPVEVTK